MSKEVDLRGSNIIYHNYIISTIVHYIYILHALTEEHSAVVIIEEGNLPNPWCPLCDMLVTWKALNGVYRRTAQYKREEERNRRRLSAEEEREGTSRYFSAYGRSMEIVTSLQYLGEVILSADNEWPAVVRNLSRARAACKRMTIILSRDGAEPRVSILFFKAMVQAVMLFGSETWVVTPCTGRYLGGFQDQVERRLMGRLLQQRPDGKWAYTLSEKARGEAGLQTMEEYIWQCHNMVAQYISTVSLLDLYEGSERAPGARVGMRWRDQAGINLAGTRELEAAAAEKGGGEE